MIYDELQRRYGTHIAKRVQSSLNRSEFSNASLDNLHKYLEGRAEKAAINYKNLMDNPLERGNVRSEVLYKIWTDAEDLAYLLAIAEDVSVTTRALMLSSAE